MPSNFTENYQLNQWEAGDKVQRVDFNADNVKIDAAIKAQADALSAETAARTALAAQVAKKGNCQIYHITRQGTGTIPFTLTFPGKPLVVASASLADNCHYFAISGQQRVLTFYGTTPQSFDAEWSGNSVTFSGGDSGRLNYICNHSSNHYVLVALLAMDE